MGTTRANIMVRSSDCRSRDGRRDDLSIFRVWRGVDGGEHAAFREVEVDTLSVGEREFVTGVLRIARCCPRLPDRSQSTAESLNNIGGVVYIDDLLRLYRSIGKTNGTASQAPACRDDFRRCARHVGPAHQRRAPTTSEETEDG